MYIFILFSMVDLGRGTLWHLQRFLQSLSTPFPLSPLLPHSWNSNNRYHFSIYIYVYTVFAPYSPSYTLSLPSPHPTGTTPLSVTWFTLLFSNFVKEKKDIIFVPDSDTRSFFVTFPCIIYIGSSPLFFLSTLVVFFWQFQQV
jgi:hypothetical protein